MKKKKSLCAGIATDNITTVPNSIRPELVDCDVKDPHPIKSIPIPNEVLFVWSIQHAGMPVGLETFNKCKAIKESYPEWFK